MADRMLVGSDFGRTYSARADGPLRKHEMPALISINAARVRTPQDRSRKQTGERVRRRS
jgi:hypothetical protein